MEISKPIKFFFTPNFQPYMLEDSNHTKSFYTFDAAGKRYKIRYYKNPFDASRGWQRLVWEFQACDSNPKHHWKFLKNKFKFELPRPQYMILSVKYKGFNDLWS